MSSSSPVPRKDPSIRKMMKAGRTSSSPRTSRAHASRRQSMLILDLQGRKKDILRQILDVRHRLSKLDDVEVEQTVAQLSLSPSSSANVTFTPLHLKSPALEEGSAGDGDMSPTFSPTALSGESKPGSSAEAMYHNQRKYNKGLESLKNTRDGQLAEIKNLTARLQGEHDTLQQDKMKQDFIHALDTPMQTAIYTLTDLITDLTKRQDASDTAVADELATCLKTLTAANPYLPAFDFSRPEHLHMTAEKLKWLRTFHNGDKAGDEEKSAERLKKEGEAAAAGGGAGAGAGAGGDATAAAVGGESSATKLAVLEESDRRQLMSLGFDCLSIEEDVLQKKWLPGLFASTGLLEQFQVPTSVFQKFLDGVRRGYRANSYHNYRHAFDVTQMTYALVNRTSAGTKLRPIELFSLLLTALTHDIDHGGKTNDFLVNTMSPLALLYNHRSVNENHHCCFTFKLLSQPDTNVLAAIPPAEWRQVRKIMVSCFLATDMSQHFEIVNRFSMRVQGRGAAASAGFCAETPEDTLLLMNVLLHASDLSNPARPFAVARGWADNIVSEWYQQGDMERMLGLPESPMCARPDPKIEKWVSIAGSQIGFIDHVVAPMFVLIKKFIEPEEKSMGSDEHGAECLDLVTECVTQLKENRSTWVGIKAGGAPPEPEPAAAAAAADGAAKAEPEPAAVVEEADKEEDLE